MTWLKSYLPTHNPVNFGKQVLFGDKISQKSLRTFFSIIITLAYTAQSKFRGTSSGLLLLGRPILLFTDCRFCCAVICAFHLSPRSLKNFETSSVLQVRGLVVRESSSVPDSSDETRLVFRAGKRSPLLSSSLVTLNLLSSF